MNGRNSELEEMLAELAASFDDAKLQVVGDRLINMGEWTSHHSTLARHLIALDKPEAGATFFAQWMVHHGGRVEALTELALCLFHAGRIAEARETYLRIWRSVPDYIRPMAGDCRDGLPPDDPRRDEEFLAAVDSAFAAPEPAPYPLPCRGFECRGRRGLMLAPPFVNEIFPNDLLGYFLAGAAEAGVTLDPHAEEGIVYPDLSRQEPETRARALADFLARIEAERPEFLVLDGTFLPRQGAVTPELLRAMKESYDFRLVCLIRDCLPESLGISEAWLPVADALAVFDPAAALFAGGRFPENAVAIPVPALTAPPGPAHERREIGLGFAGSIAHLSRQMVIPQLMERDFSFRALIGRERKETLRDPAAYGAFLRRCRAVLNFSAHSENGRLVTGRVWEAVAAGALLVEQEHEGTARFFAPWRHYFPWRNPADIAAIARFLARHPHVGERVAAAATDFARRHYGSERIWRALLGTAFRDR